MSVRCDRQRFRFLTLVPATIAADEAERGTLGRILYAK